MQLPEDFQDFIHPPTIRTAPVWHDLLSGQTAYAKQFYVRGIRAAGQALAIHNVRNLWSTIAGIKKKSAAETIANRERNDRPGQEVVTSVPDRWKDDIPDINDSGEAKAYTTYWREYAKNQLFASWDAQLQTLPKALLSIVAVYLAAERKGVNWADVAQRSGLRVAPAIFWIVGYTSKTYDDLMRSNSAAEQDAYKACELEYELSPVKPRNETLRRAAAGAPITYETAERLASWLALQGVACGPILIVPKNHKVKPAGERFLRR